MTELKLLKKTIRNYHRLLAMYALTPLLIFCLLGAYLLFHNKSYLYDNLPMMTCYAVCTLMAFLGIMSMSHDYLPEIISHVNDIWADSIEKELKPQLFKAANEELETAIKHVLTNKAHEDIDTLRFTISEIRKCQKEAEEYLLELEKKVEIHNSDDTT